MQANQEIEKSTVKQDKSEVSDSRNPEESAVKTPEKSDDDGYTDIEKRAIERGWRPKESYKGDDWRPAKEFLDRGELLEKIHRQNREISGMKDTLRNVEDLMQRREEFARQKTIEELTKLRREAIQEGDVATVERLDEDLNKTRQEESRNAAKKPLPRDVMDWVKERQNSWFNRDNLENAEMMDEAAKIEHRVYLLNPTIDPLDALEMTEAEIKRKYPHRFKNAARTKTPDVESDGERAPVRRKKYDPSKVTPQLKRIANDFVRRGVFKSDEEYYEAYFGA